MLNYYKHLIQYFILLGLCFLMTSCEKSHQDLPTYEIVIENHKFTPAEILIPAETKVKLVVHNKDDEAEEFECPSLRREKIIPKNSKADIIIAPLKKGIYEFFGDFNPTTAQGKIRVE